MTKEEKAIQAQRDKDETAQKLVDSAAATTAGNEAAAVDGKAAAMHLDAEAQALLDDATAKAEAFRKKFSAKQASRKAAPTRGAGVSAMARQILGLMREAGQGGDGLTVPQIRELLDFAGASTQLRRRIRDAQASAAASGDMVYTDNAYSVTMPDGTEKALPKASKRYYVVEKALADCLDDVTVSTVKNAATDFVYGQDVKGTSRASLTDR